MIYAMFAIVVVWAALQTLALRAVGGAVSVLNAKIDHLSGRNEAHMQFTRQRHEEQDARLAGVSVGLAALQKKPRKLVASKPPSATL